MKSKPNVTTRQKQDEQAARGENGKNDEKSGPSAWIAAAVLAIAIGAVYGRYLDVPFIFDDSSAITKNPSIKSLWPLMGTAESRGPLHPPPQTPIAGRPLVNLSFAINHALSGFSPIAFHAVNVAIHFLSAFLLWAIVRRTLQLPYFAGRFSASAGWLALAVAIIWALHPLQTEAVIYATQRTELMFAFFYLATLYCSLRYWAGHPLPAGGRPGEGGRAARPGEGALIRAHSMQIQRAFWLTLAVFACAAGMASKEVMVSAPLVILLFDRTFISGSLRKASQQWWPLYVGLAATWIVVIALNASAPRNRSAGFSLDVTGYTWWLTQSKVLLMYLKLVIWPGPLLIHYDFEYFKTFTQAWMYVVPVFLLVLATFTLLWRNSPLGFLATWVFAILSPTLLIPIVTEMAAERRMYLPLAAIVTLVVVGGYWLVRMLLARREGDHELIPSVNVLRAATILPAVVLATALGVVSAHRLVDYYQEPTLWQQVLQYYPGDFMAQFYRGNWLAKLGRYDEAIAALKIARVNSPDDVDVINNLAVVYLRSGRYPEGIPVAQLAIKLYPDSVDGHMNLGLLLSHVGRMPEALAELNAALARSPNDVDVLRSLGETLVTAGQLPDAIQIFERATKLEPNKSEFYFRIGNALASSGKKPEAIEYFRRALALDPNDVESQYNLGALLCESNNFEEAVPHFNQALRVRPDLAEAHNGLALALRKTGRPDLAVEQYQAAVKLKPDLLDAHFNLAQTFATLNRPKEAIATAEKAVEIARSSNRQGIADQIGAWLSQYQDELRRSNNPSTTTAPGQNLDKSQTQ